MFQNGLRGLTAAKRNVTYSQSVTRWFGFGSHVSENDPDVIEKAKQRHLQGVQKLHVHALHGHTMFFFF